MIADGVGSKKSKPYLCLADTGSSSSLMAEQLASGRCSTLEQTKPTKWVTKAGNFDTSSKAVIDRTRLPQFTCNRTFTSRWHLLKKTEDDRYFAVLGRDQLQKLGIDIINSK